MVVFLSIKASDDNGLSDIKAVSFLSHKPDSTINGPIQLLDDGGSVSGDQAAGDGIYSVLNFSCSFKSKRNISF